MKKLLLTLCCVLLLATTAQAAQKKVYNPAGASANSPFSSVVEAGGLLFVSGQVPIDAAGKVPAGFEAQMEQALKNVEAALNLAGSSMDDVVKVTVFLEDFDDFSAMNNIYMRYFKGQRPARSTVEVSKLAMDVKVEIEVIATR